MAIAKDDVPLEHWWALGRLYGVVHGRKVLLSWGGTMFEYLMPLIFNKQYTDSLLGDACNAAVACQIAYGKKRGIPWGISGIGLQRYRYAQNLSIQELWNTWIRPQTRT